MMTDKFEPMGQRVHPELELLATEFRALAANTAIIQTQEGRHLANGLIRLAEAISRGKPVTSPALHLLLSHPWFMIWSRV